MDITVFVLFKSSNICIAVPEFGRLHPGQDIEVFPRLCCAVLCKQRSVRNVEPD
jgi:hypothetical protein